MAKFLLIFICIVALIVAPLAHADYFTIDEKGRLFYVDEGQVLSRGSDEAEASQNSNGSSGSGSSSSSQDSSGSSESSSSGPGSGDEETRIEIRTEDGRSRTEVRVEDGETRVKTEVRTPLGRIRIEARDGRLVIKEEAEAEDEFKDEDEDELEEEEATESGERIEIEEHEFARGVRVRARGDKLEIEQRGIGALLLFPLTIGANNELIVTTPAGTKVVTILPAVAVANILESNIMDRVLTFRAQFATPIPAATASSIPRESPFGTPGAELVTPAQSPTVIVTSPVSSPIVAQAEDIELTLVGNTLAYRIRGAKDVKLLGLLPITSVVSADVSAETGEVLSVNQPFFLRFFPFLFT